MNSAAIFILVVSVAFSSAQWRQGPESGGQQQWGQGGVGGRQQSFGSNGQGSASGNQRGQGQGLGRSLDGETRYGANIIDTPTMIGYEATIPGATSRFVEFRNEGRGGRSGYGNMDQGYGVGNGNSRQFGQQGGNGRGQSGFGGRQGGGGQSGGYNSGSRGGQGW